MVAPGRVWRRCLLLLALIAPLLTLTPAPRAEAADGTVLRTITADVPTCSVSTGLAFDGSRLLVSCNYTNQIFAVSPADGSRLETYTIPGLPGIGALAWDRGRGELWACEGFAGDDHNLYRIDLETSTATFQFRTSGCVDGLAYDGSDDTIWSGADVAQSIQHYSIDGTLIASHPLSGKIGSCGKSGIAVGGPFLFVANNGCSEIYKMTKDASSSSLFGSYPARLEDLECDDITFADTGRAAIWSKDAYDNILNAFELNPGDCGYGGFSSSITLQPSSDSAPVGSSHAVNARVIDPTTGLPAEGVAVDFDVVNGPNSGADGGCFHRPGTFPPISGCITDADGEVGFLYRGADGPGTDRIEASATVPADTFPGTQVVTASAMVNWLDPVNLVALGDSYSSGEGVPGYSFPPPGSTHHNRCHRSLHAYSTQFVAPHYFESVYETSLEDLIDVQFDFIACSGATTRNVRLDGRRQYNEPAPQLAQSVVDVDTNALTITIGGNDAGFSEILQGCARHACTADDYHLIDGRPITEWLPDKIDSLQDDLVNVYEEAKSEVGEAAIFVLGYPQLFPELGEEQGCVKLFPWRGEQDFLRDMTSRMNDVIAAAASEAGVHFVPVEAGFAGHEVCGNGGEWINAVTIGRFLWTIGNGTFHPKESGQTAYADILEEFIDELLADGAPTLSNGLPRNPDPAAGLAAFTAAAASTPLGSLTALDIATVAGSTGPCANGEPIFAPDQVVQIGATEFAPASEVSVTFASGDQPVRSLATVTTDSAGDFVTTVTIPGDALVGELGELQAAGTDLDGANRLALRIFGIDVADQGCDTNAPTVTIDSPQEGATYVLGEIVNASYACDDGSTGSGVATCSGPVTSGAPIDTATVGAHTFSVTTSDNVGNTATVEVRYTVAYGFSGFLSPIENPPVVNVVNAGRTVPVKWILSTAVGGPVDSASSFVRLSSVAVSCDPGVSQDAIEEVVATGQGLKSLGEGRWQYDWRTSGAFSGSCRELRLTLADGTVHTAVFRFR